MTRIKPGELYGAIFDPSVFKENRFVDHETSPDLSSAWK